MQAGRSPWPRKVSQSVVFLGTSSKMRSVPDPVGYCVTLDTFALPTKKDHFPALPWEMCSDSSCRLSAAPCHGPSYRALQTYRAARSQKVVDSFPGSRSCPPKGVPAISRFIATQNQWPRFFQSPPSPISWSPGTHMIQDISNKAGETTQRRLLSGISSQDTPSRSWYCLFAYIIAFRSS